MSFLFSYKRQGRSFPVESEKNLDLLKDQRNKIQDSIEHNNKTTPNT